MARYPGPYNDLDGPFLAVDKLGNSYVAGTHVVNDSINILCVKYNTSGAQVWATLYKYPGEGYFAPSGLALDTFGNAYVTSLYGQGTSYPLNTLLVKFNSLNGSTVWAKKYVGHYGTSYPFDIKIDRLNNIYVSGYSDTSHLLIKYNINGDSVWVRKYQQPPNRDIAFACAIDDSMNIIIAGVRRTCVSFPPPGGCFDSLMAAKYSANGVLRWIKIYKYNTSDASGRKIAVDQLGSIYIGGVTGISGFGVYLTLKYDRNGNQQWAKIYDAPGSGDNGLKGIEFDKINNALFVTGGAVTNGIQMATTIKYNPSTGDSVWVRRDTGPYTHGDARDVKMDTSGNIYLAGVSSNPGSGAPVDILTLRYSPQGVPIWIVTYNGSFNGIDIGRSLDLDNLNNVYVLGTSQNGFQLSDYVLIKYVQYTGISSHNNQIPTEFKMEQNYPNPFNSTTIIKYQLPKTSDIVMKLYDMLGREVATLISHKLNAGVYDYRFDATELSSGIYIYRLTAGGNIIDTKKLIIVK
ncbi:MAG: T9SS type A sorting domain-containing protein [Ignavibacteria bacterium]|nr:T9SS type A sorting domain-containing protein [Ignavibacteria bacterium]